MSDDWYNPGEMDWFRLFSKIEATGVSVWVRESQSMLAFPTILIIHAIGMGLLVGTAVAINLRIFGFAPRIPLSALTALTPILHVGFWLNATSGLLLLVGFPTRHLMNPIFYLKLGFIVAAMLDTRWILNGVARSSFTWKQVVVKGSLLAAISLVLWSGSIVLGKLLYYTFTRRDPFGNPY